MTSGKISPHIDHQTPSFIKEFHPNFVLFIKAYYQWLESTDGILDRISNLTNYADIDNTSDEFLTFFTKEFSPSFPQTNQGNKRNLIKNIKDFYRERGNESSYELFFRVVFNKVVEFYYPSNDVLRVDDGTWQVDYFLRGIKVSGDCFVFVDKTITGTISGATAIVESVTEYQIGSETVYDLYLSPTSILGTFFSDEEIFFEDARIRIKRSVRSISPLGGKKYEVGDPVRLISKDGRGFKAVVSKVNNGEVKGVKILDTGINYASDDFLVLYPYDEDALSYIDGLVLFIDPSREGTAIINAINGSLDGIRDVSDRGVLFSSPSDLKSKPFLSRRDNKGNYLPYSKPISGKTWYIGDGTNISYVDNGGVDNSAYVVLDGSLTTQQKFIYNTNSDYLHTGSGFAPRGKILRATAYLQRGATSPTRYVWFGEGNDTVWHGANFDLQTETIVSSQNIVSYAITRLDESLATGTGWIQITVDYSIEADMSSSTIYLNPNLGSAILGNSLSASTTGNLYVNKVSLMETSWDNDIVETEGTPQLAGRNGNRILWFFGGKTVSTSSIEDYNVDGDFTLITVPTFTSQRAERKSKIFGKNRSDRDESLYPSVDLDGCKLFLDANYGVTVDRRNEVAFIKDLSPLGNDGYRINTTDGVYQRPILTRTDNKENLVAFCEDFSVPTRWVPARANVNANETYTLDDRSLLFLKEDGTAGNTHYIAMLTPSYFNTYSGQVYTVSFKLKSTNRGVSLRALGGFAGGYTTFNPQSNTVVETAGEASSPTIVDIGDGVKLCTVNVTSNTTTSAGGYLLLYIYDTANNLRAYNGDSTSGIWIGEIQCRRSFTSSEYISTMIKDTENLLLWSEDLSNASHLKTGCTIESNTTESPIGDLTANSFIEGSTNTNHEVFQSFTANVGITYRASVYVKKSNRRYFQIYGTSSQFGTQDWANYDLELGVVSQKGTSGTAKIENVGNGWWRCTRTLYCSLTNVFARFFFASANSGTASRAPSFLGNSLEAFEIWGAQVSDCRHNRDYVKTTSIPKIGTVSSQIQVAGSNGNRFMLFDGVNDLMYVNNIQNYTYASPPVFTYTIGFFCTNTSANYQSLFSFGRLATTYPFILLQQYNTQLIIDIQGNIRSTNSTALSTISANNAYVVSVVCTGTTLKMYVNGIEKISVPFTVTNTYPLDIFTIGAQRRNSTDQYFNGGINTFLFFDRALSDTERTALDAQLIEKLTGVTSAYDAVITLKPRSDTGLFLDTEYSQSTGKFSVTTKADKGEDIDISDISGIQLRLDARKGLTVGTDNTISQWNDQSNNRYDAFQTTQAYKPIVTRADNKENGLVNSNNFTSVDWNIATYPVASVVGGQEDPFGGNNAYLVTAVSGGGARCGIYHLPSTTDKEFTINTGLAAGYYIEVKYIASIYVKKNNFRYLFVGELSDSSWHGINVDLDRTTPFVGSLLYSSKIEDVGNGWLRVSFIATKLTSSKVTLGVWFSDAGDNTLPPIISKAGTEAFYVYGAQVQIYEPWKDTSYLDVPSTTKQLAGMNGNASVYFDGVNDYMIGNTPQTNLRLSADFSMFAVVRSYNITDNTIFSNFIAATSGILWRVTAQKNYIRTERSGTNSNSPGTHICDSSGQCDIIYSIKSGTNVSMYRNGVLEILNASVQNSVVSSRAYTVGAASALSLVLRGNIGELIVIDRAVTDEERDRIYNYLKSSWKKGFISTEDSETFPNTIYPNEPKLITLKKTDSTFECFDNGDLVKVGDLGESSSITEDYTNELVISDPETVEEWKYNLDTNNVRMWYKSSNAVFDKNGRVEYIRENRDLIENADLTENLLYPSELTAVDSWSLIAGSYSNVSYQTVISSDWDDLVMGAIYFGDNTATRTLYRTMLLNKYTSYVISCYVITETLVAPTTSDFNFVFNGSSQTMTDAVIENIQGNLYRVSLNVESTATSSNHGITKTGANNAIKFFVNGIQVRRLGTDSEYVRTTTAVKNADNNGLIAAQTVYAEKPYLSVGNRVQTNTLPTLDLTNASWTKTNCTVTSESITNPLGTTSGVYEIKENSASASHSISLTNLSEKPTVVSGYKYKFSFYAKANTLEWISVVLSGAFVITNQIWINLKTGSVGTVSGTPEYHIDPVGDGWFKISFNLSAYKYGVADPIVYICSDNGATSYMGTGTKSLYLYGIAFEDINDNKNIRGNALVYSKAKTVGWLASNSAVVDNIATNWDGKLTASTITSSAGSATHRLESTATDPNRLINMSGKASLISIDFYIQYNNYRYVYCSDNTDSVYRAANVDLLNGVIDYTTGLTSSSIEAITDENRLLYSKIMTAQIFSGAVGTSATIVTSTAGTSSHYFYQQVSNGVAGTFTATFRLKYTNHRYLKLVESGDGTSRGVVVDLLTGTITGYANIDSYSITLDSSGYYVIYFTYTKTASNFTMSVVFFPNGTWSLSNTYTASGTETFDCGGIALSKSPLKDTIITTTSSPVYAWHKLTISHTRTNAGNAGAILIFSSASVPVLSQTLAGTEKINVSDVVMRFQDWESYPVLTTTYPIISSVNSNQSLFFNGTTNLSHGNKDLDLTGDYIVACSVNLVGGVDGTKDYAIMGSEWFNNYGMVLRVGGSTGYIKFRTNQAGTNTAIDSSVSITRNAVQTITIVRISGQGKMYLNGTLVGYATLNDPVTTIGANTDLNVGAHPTGAQGWQGYINEIIVKGGTFTETQRKAIEDYLDTEWKYTQGSIANVSLNDELPSNWKSGSQRSILLSDSSLHRKFSKLATTDIGVTYNLSCLVYSEKTLTTGDLSFVVNENVYAPTSILPVDRYKSHYKAVYQFTGTGDRALYGVVKSVANSSYPIRIQHFSLKKNTPVAYEIGSSLITDSHIGQIGAVALYNRSLSDQEQKLAENYIRQRFLIREKEELPYTNDIQQRDYTSVHLKKDKNQRLLMHYSNQPSGLKNLRGSFWVACFFEPDFAGNYIKLVAKEETSSKVFVLEKDTGGSVKFKVSSNNTSYTGSVESATFGNKFADETKYFVYAYHEDTVGLGISIDNGTIDAIRYTGGVSYSNFANLYVGGDSSGGKISKLIIGTGILGESERAELYNSGKGIFYDDISTGLKGKILSFSELSEVSNGSEQVERANSIDLLNKNFLALYNNLEDATWTKSNLTVTKRIPSYTELNGTFSDNVIGSPFQLGTGKSFFETATTGVHSVTPVVVDTIEANRLYKVSLYFKPVGRDIRITCTPNEFLEFDCYINGTTGEVIQYTGDIPPRVAIVKGFDGWFYFEKSITTSGSAFVSNASVVISTLDGTENSLVGDITKGFYFDTIEITPVTEANPELVAYDMVATIGGSATHYIDQTISNVRAYSRLNFVVYAKPRELDSIVLEFNGTAFNYLEKPQSLFSLRGNGVASERNYFGSTESSIEKVGDWYKCTISAVTNTDGTVIPRVYLYKGTSRTFAVTVTDSLLIAFVENSLTETEYEQDNAIFNDTLLNTYSVSGTSIVEGREFALNQELQNLFYPSQVYSGSGYTTSNVTYASINSYDWQERFTDVAVFGDNTVQRSIYKNYGLETGQYYTLSVFVRMDSGLAPVSTSTSADFALRFESSHYASTSTEDLGGGLYRVSLTRLATTSTVTTFGISKYVAGTAETFKLQGIQLRLTASSPDYLETTTAKKFGSLLPSYTFGTENLMFPSEPRATSDWASSSNVTISTVFPSSWASLFDRAVYFGDNSSDRYFYRQLYTVSGTSYKFSAYVRMTDGSAPVVGGGVLASADLALVFADDTDISATYTSEDLGDGLYRVSRTVNGTGTYATFGAYKYTTNSSKTFEIQGFQLTRASLSNEYIRTYDKPYYLTKEHFSNVYMDSIFLKENSSNTDHYVYSNAGILAYGEKYRLSVLAKKKERNLTIKLKDTIASSGKVDFDLAKGIAQNIIDSNGDIISASCEEIILDTRENWIPYSKNMVDLYAFSSNVIVTGLSGATVNSITCSASSVAHQIRVFPSAPEFVPIAGTSYRVSVDLKRLTHRYFVLHVKGDTLNHAIAIDLTNKIIPMTENCLSSSVELLANDVTRFSFEFLWDVTISTTTLEVRVAFNDVPTTTIGTFTAVGTETVQIEGLGFQETRATNEILETQDRGKKQNIWYNCIIDFYCSTKNIPAQIYFHNSNGIGNLIYTGTGKAGLWLAKPRLISLESGRGSLSDIDNVESILDVDEFKGAVDVEFGQVTQKEGYYLDEKGQLDTGKYLRDDYLYQEWSYVLYTEETLDFYKDHINKILHPSGTKLFGGFRFKGDIE